MPIRTVWQLQMRQTERLAVIACFAIGLTCCVIGIFRFWQLLVVNIGGNLTGTSLTTFMFCTVELMLGGLCTNVPTLQSFYVQWRAKRRASELEDANSQSEFKRLQIVQSQGQPKSGQPD
ncbi:hypothetical protein CORC01_05373 [Colletotrichum orchidophilum]|uniref:Rhodopsin domain-containing protein n=1 Tax=Colletotrichum orchidophilum TaxID=1209926 RepID=A0A1G4BDC4_9PEZI|nr:uncharacterized protein CORC01_05373 [Colletotrichum orchidophilum]OHE99332.1 hypothetical protein CORC01_05373 [Colletotrichum orchidophilum]